MMSPKGFSLSVIAMALLVCAAPVLAGDLDRFTNLEGTLDIAGGTAHIPVMNEAAKRIMTFNPQVRITRWSEALFQSLKERCAILAVTRSLSQMCRLADRVLILCGGQLVSKLSRAEFQNQANCLEIMEAFF